MERLAWIVDGWMSLTLFTKNLDVRWFMLNLRCLTGFWIRLWLSRDFFLLSVETATFNLPRIFLKWLVFYLSILSRDLLFRCNGIMFQTCLNLTMRNQNGIDKVVQISLLLTWETLTRVSTVSTSDNDH